MNKRRTVLLFILSGVWLLFIFTNSLKNAELSSEQSAGIVETVGQVLIGAGIPLEADLLTHYIRKLAHFTEFGLLSLLLGLSFLSAGITRARLAALVLCICLICAAADEYIQTFSPGRSAQISDVIVDLSGAAAALICFGIAHGLLIIRSK